MAWRAARGRADGTERKRAIGRRTSCARGIAVAARGILSRLTDSHKGASRVFLMVPVRLGRSMDLIREYEAQDQWRDWDAMLERLPIARDQTVLDLGCGPGLVSGRLAKLAANIVGVDRNAEFVSAARQRCPTNCTFLEADLYTLETRDIPNADGLWSSFAAAYFPDFAPILKRWTSCLSPGAWVALVEIDDMWRGHHPLPPELHAAFAEFEEHICAECEYDYRMGRRLGAVCRNIGLTVSEEYRTKRPSDDGIRWPKPHLPSWLLGRTAVVNSDARQAVRDLGAERFNEITQVFLDTITAYRSIAQPRQL